jgi:antitoxin MazE
METSLVKIGNSRGIIIPKKILNRLGPAKKFILEEKDDGLVFFPVREEKPRKNWRKMFTEAQRKGIIPDLAPLEPILNDFDEKEWLW